MVKDPVCGMTISEDIAKAKLGFHGQTYYFCSMLGKQLLEREPQKYVPPSESHEKEPST